MAKWQWRDIEGKLKNYKPSFSSRIEQLSVGDSFRVNTKNPKVYEMKKFTEATAEEMNITTKQKVKVERFRENREREFQKLCKWYEYLKKKIGFEIVLQFMGNDERWRSYDQTTSKIIEKLKNGESTFNSNTTITKITLKDAEHVNMRTNKVRQLKRISIERGANSVEYPSWLIISDTNFHQNLSGSPQYSEPQLIELNLNTMLVEIS